MTTRTSPEISPEQLYSPPEQQTGFRIEFEADETAPETLAELSETYLYVIVDDRYFACDEADNLMLEAYELIPSDEAQAAAMAELLATEESQTIEILYETNDQGEVWSIQTYALAGINELGQPLFTISSSTELRTLEETEDITDESDYTLDDMTDGWQPEIAPGTAIELSSEPPQTLDEPVQLADMANEATITNETPAPHINIEHYSITVIKSNHAKESPAFETTTTPKNAKPIIELPDSDTSFTPAPVKEKETIPDAPTDDVPEQIDPIPQELPLSIDTDELTTATEDVLAVDITSNSAIEYIAPADDYPIATDYPETVTAAAIEMTSDSAKAVPETLPSESTLIIEDSSADIPIVAAAQRLEDTSNTATPQPTEYRSERATSTTTPIVLPQGEIIHIRPPHPITAGKEQHAIKPLQIAVKQAVNHGTQPVDTKIESAQDIIPPIATHKKTPRSKRPQYIAAPIIKAAEMNTAVHAANNKVMIDGVTPQIKKTHQLAPKSFDRLRPRSQPYSTVLSADIASTDSGDDDLVITLRPTVKITKALQLSVEATV